MTGNNSYYLRYRGCNEDGNQVNCEDASAGAGERELWRCQSMSHPVRGPKIGACTDSSEYAVAGPLGWR